MTKDDLGTYPELLKSFEPRDPSEWETIDEDSTKEEIEMYNDELANFEEYESYPEPYMEDMFPKAEDFDNRDSAWEYVISKNYKAQIYTEIEGDTGGTWYDRGFHIVNRTGSYAVVIDSRFRPMIYTTD